MQVLPNESLKEDKLKRHLNTVHPNFVDKPLSFWKEKEANVKRMSLDIDNSGTVSLGKVTKALDSLENCMLQEPLQYRRTCYASGQPRNWIRFLTNGIKQRINQMSQSSRTSANALRALVGKFVIQTNLWKSRISSAQCLYATKQMKTLRDFSFVNLLKP